jgi:hypothetical protein
MNASAKLGGFVATLAVLFGVGALAGGLLDPAGEAPAEATGAAHGEGEHAMAAADAPSVRGLAVAADGLRLVVETPELHRGATQRLAFRIVDERGRTVRDFDVEHTKRMHLILARRDLTSFAHLHPEQRPDGTWTTSARLEQAGSYRLFADFSHEGRAVTLASDLRVDGAADLRPLPAPRPTASTDGGYAVRLDAGDVRPGVASELRFTVTKDGVPVQTEPYLGAGGHLVALRDGDLAFLHVHPDEHGEGKDDAIGFGATFPTAGRYRLFLQFRHEGRVHTVAFTQEVA